MESSELESWVKSMEPLVEMDESLPTESDAEVWRSGGNEGDEGQARTCALEIGKEIFRQASESGAGQGGAAGPTFDAGAAAGAAV